MDFSRTRFDADPEGFVRELQAALRERLRSATDPEAEAQRIVRELIALGHRLTSFDASDDFEHWSDDPLYLSFYFDEREVEVGLREVREREPAPQCPTCSEPMRFAQLLLRVNGHGSIDHEALPWRLTIGSAMEWKGVVDTQTVEIVRPLLECPRGHGVWLSAAARASSSRLI